LKTVIHRRWQQCLVAAFPVVLLAACTPAGQRPSFLPSSNSTAPTTLGSTGNIDIDAIANSLQNSSAAVFTAVYSVTARLGGTTATATVVHDHERWRVTTGAVTMTNRPLAATCQGTPVVCHAGIDERPLAPLLLTSTFWGESASQALKVSATRAAATITLEQKSIAGQNAKCLSIPAGNNQFDVFCVNPDGSLARWNDSSRDIVLTQYSAKVDPAQLALPAPIT
jgi:hypothetical protein